MCLIKKALIQKKITIVIYSVVILFTTNFNAEAQPKSWIVPAAASNVKNPLVNSPIMSKDVKMLYTSYCAPCHGEKGKGDGIAAAGLNPRPADHTSTVVQNETDGDLFYKLSEGRSPMPGYKAILNENQRWELISYIRTLNKGGKK